MIVTWNLTIPELTGAQMRRAYVYVPDSFSEDESLRYPVLYMFDGHNLFFDEEATYGKSWGLLDYMDETQTQLIIAAVECNHETDGGRLREYSPYTFQDPEWGFIRGRGRETMDWMVSMFKPYIDQFFPTLPEREHTFIAGSSMGGLMSLYAVTAYNKVFSRSAALSPSVGFAPKRVNHLLRTAPLEPDTLVYMDYGSNEMGDGMREQFTKVASILLSRGVWLNCRIVPNGDHSEASWERQLPFFINALLYDPWPERWEDPGEDWDGEDWDDEEAEDPEAPEGAPEGEGEDQ